MADLGHRPWGAGQPLYPGRSTSRMIVFFAFFYTAIVFNPADTADNLKKHGGFIPGIRPGAKHRRLSEFRAHPPDRGRRRLPGPGLPAAGDLISQVRGALLFRRHQPADRGLGDHGYGGADPLAPAWPTNTKG